MSQPNHMSAAESAAAIKHRRETESQYSKPNRLVGPVPSTRQGLTSGVNKWLKEAADAASLAVPKAPPIIKKNPSGIPEPIGKLPKGPQPSCTTAKKSGSDNLQNPPEAQVTIILSDNEGSAIASDGEVPVKAVKTCTHTAAQLAGVNGNNSRCACFVQKYAGLTPKQTLKWISSEWHSPLYSHFEAPRIVLGADSAVVHRFVCKKHPSKHVNRMEYQDSTRNLARHVKMCDPDDTPEVEQITAYAHGATYSPGCLRFLIAMWCTWRHCPFTIVEDPEFQEIVCMLYNKAEGVEDDMASTHHM
ncbi:hypothetical protein C8Q80DRAFT_1123949 [Daedaleopsis nitida]|nr:hypothetical protein C8Q80DRAFT_1123949 [Daedaleopsis nitida]